MRLWFRGIVQAVICFVALTSVSFFGILVAIFRGPDASKVYWRGMTQQADAHAMVADRVATRVAGPRAGKKKGEAR